MATLNAIVTEVERTLSMFGGVDVQLYAQDRIKRMIQRAFNLTFDKIWWDDYMDALTSELDGVTGAILAVDPDPVDRFTDIYAIWHENDADALPRIPRNVNPSSLRRMGVEPSLTAPCKFIIRPTDATGSVTVRFRNRPAAFSDDGEVAFDNDLLIFTAVHMFLIEDGTNENSAVMYKKLADERFTILRNNQVVIPFATDGYSSTPDPFTEWQG